MKAHHAVWVWLAFAGIALIASAVWESPHGTLVVVLAVIMSRLYVLEGKLDLLAADEGTTLRELRALLNEAEQRLDVVIEDKRELQRGYEKLSKLHDQKHRAWRRADDERERLEQIIASFSKD